MSEKKKTIVPEKLAADINEIRFQLAQLDEAEIEQLKRLLDESPLAVRDVFSTYFAAQTQPPYAPDKLNAQISLSAAQKDALINELQKRKLSLNQLLDNLVQEFLKHNTISEEGAILTEDDPIWQIVGAGKSDVTDGSINHDHYIYGTPKIES